MRTAIWLPYAGWLEPAFRVQSLIPSAKDCCVPSVYWRVPLAETGPLVVIPRKDSVVAPGWALTVIGCPLQTTLSGRPAATFGQVKLTPPTVTLAPGVTPACARACAERLKPSPSALALTGARSSLIAVLLNAAMRLPGVATTASAVFAQLCLPAWKWTVTG